MKVDFPISQRAIELIHFNRFLDNYLLLKSYIFRPKFLLNFLITLIIFSPIFLFFIYVWKDFFNHNLISTPQKYLYISLNLSQLLLFFLCVDYGRWISFLIFSQTFLFFQLSLKNRINLNNIIKLSNSFYNYSLLVLIIIYVTIDHIYELFPLKFVNIIITSLTN